MWYKPRNQLVVSGGQIRRNQQSVIVHDALARLPGVSRRRAAGWFAVALGDQGAAGVQQLEEDFVARAGACIGAPEQLRMQRFAGGKPVAAKGVGEQAYVWTEAEIGLLGRAKRHWAEVDQVAQVIRPSCRWLRRLRC